ncbi:SDR family oxidoreductase [Brevifollis gellanilyticus]|uniref:dTDP-4-dehydrorhamnose reductase n=1 Tax=Brevifollis gellanilyticus TaxID=748831 RepID=A0A512M7P2_9BACT|nr:sugar nucleotide-binding protein [Brevifollis gellanilyticus]GEP42750.1 NAD(P)-dependent oxidoreductase [Brevifollis gellanilyticus]
MKLLITGTTGRLGGVLVRHYTSRYDLLTPGRDRLDLSKPESMTTALRDMDFDLLINCAGITSPDVCEREPELAARINAEAPAVMATECQRRGARMIQISTDYVFDGETEDLLDETLITNPVNHYGRTKRDGETTVLRECPEALVARVSWLFGGSNGPSFPDQILNEVRQGKSLQAIGDKWSAPTSVHDIASWLELLWQKMPSVSGPLNLCNSGVATWQTYGQQVVDFAVELGLLAERLEVKGNRLDDFPSFIARRPRHTVMSNARLAELLGHPVRSWKEALREWLQSLCAGA